MQDMEEIVRLANAVAGEDEFTVTGPSGIQYTIIRKSLSALLMFMGDTEVGGKMKLTAEMGGELLINALVSAVKYPKLKYVDDDLFHTFPDAPRVSTPDQNRLFKEVLKLIESMKLSPETAEVVDRFLEE